MAVRRPAFAALAGVTALVVGFIGAGVMVGTTTAAEPAGACTQPVVEDAGTDVQVTTVCTVPKPAPVTETTTQTVTTTATATVTATVTATATATQTVTATAGPAKKIIGMSAPSGDWAARVAEVGTQGLKARRIFADLISSGTDQSSLIQAAVTAGMLPVVSYKVPSFTTAASGAYNGWADNAATFLASFDVPMAVVIWHEPNGDMTGPQFVAMQEQLTPHFKGVGLLKVGPILNGFLLTQPNQPAGVNEFTSYSSPTLMGLWDFFAVDTYQPGTQTSPGTLMPDARVYALEDWLDGQGKPDLPIGVGEYNGFSAQAISGVGEALLSLPEVWFGCVWNSAAARAGILTGSRLTAYQATKTDPRAQQ